MLKLSVRKLSPYLSAFDAHRPTVQPAGTERLSKHLRVELNESPQAKRAFLENTIGRGLLFPTQISLIYIVPDVPICDSRFDSFMISGIPAHREMANTRSMSLSFCGMFRRRKSRYKNPHIDTLLLFFAFTLHMLACSSLPTETNKIESQHRGVAYTLNGPFGGLAAASSAREPGTCGKPRIRKEWRRMTDPEKQSWIDAVHCMHQKPPKHQQFYSGVRTRYDDFVAFHINATKAVPATHNTGYFLPFHRYLLWIWENTLESECGYNGAQPCKRIPSVKSSSYI